MKIIVCQLGARMHYAVPKILNEENLLYKFFTDITSNKGITRHLKFIPYGLRSASLKRFLDRVPTGVPLNKIVCFNLFGLKYQHLRKKIKNREEAYKIHLWANKKFCELVMKIGYGDADCIYTFNGASLEVLIEAKKLGLKTILEQTIAPISIERSLLKNESIKFPDWELCESEDDNNFIKFTSREQMEWDYADIIICGSDFVREGIKSCGGPVEKCRVVPYGIESSKYHIVKNERQKGRLRILTIGAVGLRKGSPYVLKAAKHFGDLVEFRMVGSDNLTENIKNELRRSLNLVGTVPRSEIKSHFQWADIFLLPSICEGSATVVYEAIASGLPVICTKNTGSVIRDGIEGFIVNEGTEIGIIEAVNKFLTNENLIKEMSNNAKIRSEYFGLKDYKNRLLNVILSENND